MDRFAKLREAVAASVAEIERGEKPRMLGTLANLYFGFNPGEYAHELREQLCFAVGDELTAVAERGFVAMLLGQPLPLLADLARMNAANEYHPHWYAILAGMDLYWERERSVPEYAIEAVFALSLLLSTWDEQGGLAPASRREWSVLIYTLHPDVAERVYEALLGELIGAGADALGLLRRLKESPAAAWRGALAGRLRSEDPDTADLLEEFRGV
ncbi:MAG: hypothetical protein JST93_15050 [Acidobacteria bacterium]|nr:hypothetical protein [Acidobacteriota bacterium]